MKYEDTAASGVIMSDNALKELKILQNRFVIAPPDKAAGTFSFICRKYYMDVVAQELNIRR